MKLKYLLAILLLIPFFPVMAQDSMVLHLWSNGAPGYEKLKDEPEIAKDYYVKNIHNPSIVVYLPPKEKATGAAVIICPGGGFNLLVYNSEGVAPARFLNSIGVAAIILKYRLFREDTIYSLEKEVRQDAYRAIRTVRSHAAAWNIDTNRVGMWGFSAGGEVVSQVAYAPGYGDPKAKDPVDRLNGKPDFQILVYPGPLGIPTTVSADAPKAFLIAANDDACCSAPIVTLLEAYRQAKVPVETHIFANGNHAFNMGYRSDLQSIKAWPQLLTNWMTDSNILIPKSGAK
ncbi:Acetyl esterase/lipase [Chitinophaga sp. CF118]|uniref:alpha/beta hydrolase n=1 Tax=Chitinophaga sp. CF118 TaxID=1884367 RepID=UPI0008DF3DE8|nr:alpha/beta hydrolase [Chitinophaga sp. CF118]SFE07040.1 Acetyl esterase/lipase [Chitinophaga sp. CF118]